MTLKEEFATRNFSIYGQWLGILSMIVCFATGLSAAIAIIFNVGRGIIGIFSCVFAFFILFIEVPLLLRICPTSSTFDAMIRKVSTNYMRAAAYGGMAVVEFISIEFGASALIAAGILLSLTALSYLFAAIKGQAFVGSKTLGGQGVAQMIV